MAWTKCNHGLWEAPEVLIIAAELGIDAIHVAGCCLRVWTWADVESVDGKVRNAKAPMIDAMVRVKGFAAAMQVAGWIEVTDRGVRFPRWDRHNSKTSKKRAMDQQRHYARRNGTRAGHERDTCPTTTGQKRNKRRVEESRVEKKIKDFAADPPRPAKSRSEVQVKRDALWDAVVAEWSLPTVTRTQRGRVGRLVGEFKGCGATPAEISVRRRRLAADWDQGMDTPEAVAKHWSSAAPPASELPFSENPEWQAMKKYEVPR